MQILNLINLEKSDIKYVISRFPDGEVQVTLDPFSRKEEINVRCRITSAEELFILMQVCDILHRHGMRFSISIYYLMGMRMDRVMDFNRPFTLSIITNILDHLCAANISIFCPHSEASLDQFRNTYATHIYSEEWEEAVKGILSAEDFQMVLPDRGAVDRYFPDGAKVPADIIIGAKVRDIGTGKITSIEVENPEALDGRPLLLVDDLCDGGGTFVGLAQAIKKVKPEASVNIIVNHMVNPKGIENLSKNFGRVWFSNSYKTWENLPDNVTQIEIV